MYANYHTHTYLCNHASGTPEEYVKEAIKNKLSILGFSDHVPYPFKNGYKSTMRMDVSETEEYVSEIKCLREKYKDKIKIYIGYEAEYYPGEFNAMLENIRKYGCDYLILAQHFTDNEYDGSYSGAPCGKEIFTKYIDQITEGMKTGFFSYIAHPDLIYYRDDLDVYRDGMSKLCKAALDMDIPLEFNLLGFFENRIYPYDLFWQIAHETGNTVIIGCDAHSPQYTGKPEIYDNAVSKLKSFGITPVKDIELRSIYR